MTARSGAAQQRRARRTKCVGQRRPISAGRWIGYLSKMRKSLLLWPLAFTSLFGCGGDPEETTPTTTTGSTTSTAEIPDEGVPDECDPLVPTACVLPFPSSRYLTDDAATPTGKHVHFPEGALPSPGGGKVVIPPDGFAVLDGFSPGLAPFTHLPGATVKGLASPLDIERSLEPDSPTVIIDAETGERVPHFAELDTSVDEGKEDRRAFYVRPVVRLKDATRYIVAIRNVVSEGGQPLEPSLAFAALKNGTVYNHPSIDARRPLYEDIFKRLNDAGVEKDTLQIAWDFTTASKECHTKWAVAMRDDALAIAGDMGPDYVVDQVIDAPEAGIARRIEGHMTVPLYLDAPDAGARMVLGADGMPQQNGTADYPFSVMIPEVCTTGMPCPLVQYGHGLLGGRDEIDAGNLKTFIQTHGYVMFATDWLGMSNDDNTTIANIVAEGDMSKFATTTERSLQGFVNAILAMRMMGGGFATDPSVMFNGTSAIDPSQKYYYGNSQGGILGGALMALHVDVTRGVLGVPGQSYNLLLHRSEDFDPFFVILKIAYKDPIEQNIALGLVQMMWDRGEPTGYTAYLSGADRLPNTPDHQVLIHVAIGDHQVTTLGAHVMARAAGAKSKSPAMRPIFGVEEVALPHEGSTIVEFDFKQPPEPITNVPPSEGEDTHGWVRRLPDAQSQMNTFLRTGQVVEVCPEKCQYDKP